MSYDISPIFDRWDYEPGEVSARKILGLDGTEKLQMRIELGVLQMELTGRPDGKRPHGSESLLDHYSFLLEDYVRRYTTDKGFKLLSRECQALRDEGLQYYHRYLALFHLQEFDAVARDTQHNLDLFDLVKKYAAEETDKLSLEHFRPYVIMMQTRARAAALLHKRCYDDALQEANEGLGRIRTFFDGFEREDLFETCVETKVLRRLVEEIDATRPKGPKEALEEDLRAAVAAENFEEAAALRDKIKGFERQT